MYMAGRWVPLEMVKTIFILWAVAVVVMGLIEWWLSRRRTPMNSGKKGFARRPRGKRHKR